MDETFDRALARFTARTSPARPVVLDASTSCRRCSTQFRTKVLLGVSDFLEPRVLLEAVHETCPECEDGSR